MGFSSASGAKLRDPFRYALPTECDLTHDLGFFLLYLPKSKMVHRTLA